MDDIFIVIMILFAVGFGFLLLEALWKVRLLIAGMAMTLFLLLRQGAGWETIGFALTGMLLAGMLIMELLGGRSQAPAPASEPVVASGGGVTKALAVVGAVAVVGLGAVAGFWLLFPGVATTLLGGAIAGGGLAGGGHLVKKGW